MPNAIGPAHHNWRGQDATLEAKHYRVRTIRGEPVSCVWGCTGDVYRYEWANLTGDYEDVRDFASMCVRCHRRYDAARASMEPDYAWRPWRGGRAKLTADQVRAVRSRGASGERLAVLAAEFGISRNTAWKVAHRRSYGWVT